MLTKHVYDIQLENRKNLPVATKVGFSFMKLLGRKLISFLNSLLIYLVINGISQCFLYKIKRRNNTQ